MNKKGREEILVLGYFHEDNTANRGQTEQDDRPEYVE